MKLIAAQYGFDEFEMPEHKLDLKDDPLVLRCTITEGDFDGEWVEISDLNFSDEINEDGTSVLNFQFNSSRGSSDIELREFSEKVIRLALIASISRDEWLTTTDSSVIINA